MAEGGETPNPVSDGTAPSRFTQGTGGRDLARQITVLMRKQIAVKKRAWKWTALEVFFPLYPIFFLYLVFEFGAEFLPYEKIVTDAVDYQPAVALSTSMVEATGLPGMLHLGARLGFAPMAGASPAQAAAVHAYVCGSLAMIGANTATNCKLFPDTDTMNQHGGWVYLGEASVNADETVDPQGNYIGVEIGESSLRIRHEEMVLVADMSGDPEEYRAFSAGVLLVQGLASKGMLRYKLCPVEVAGTNATTTTECLAPHTAALELADPANIYVEKFPVLASLKLVNMRKLLYPMLFLTVLFINVQATLTQLGLEKERGIKDALALKGMKRRAFWISWWVSEGAVMTISVVVVTIAAWAVGVIEHTPAYHFFYSMWLFGLCLITMACVLSAFFNEAKTMFIVAALLLIVFAIVAYVVELLMIRLDAPYIAVLGTFLFAPVPYGHLLWVLSDGELKGTGWEEGLTRLEWGFENDYYYEAYAFMHLDILMYIGLTIFLDALIGDPLSFGRGPKDAEKAVLQDGKGLVVKGLSKKFSWKEKAEGWAGIMGAKTAMEVQAVDGLDLEVDQNTIFCLLGHNGAGKTTAMTLLAGVIAPDAGSAMVGQYDVIADRDEMRENLGMCPQHDILYDELTAKEQLLLYGTMQGLSDVEANGEADRLLEAVGMTAKSGDLANQMSGGQRRRLSLAVSLIGAPRVAFLDEPTTGMDPHNRQLCWKLLQTEKQNCTILLTTHSMEEADLLGDTLGVMDNGKMQAVGTSLELKNTYGSGYSLMCVKDGKDVPSAPIMDAIVKVVPSATIRTDIGTEITFSLPMGDNSNFPELFRKMDTDSSTLGLATFGLTQTSLEEVFLNLASSGDHAEETTGGSATAGGDSEVQNPMKSSEPVPSFACEPTFGGQFNAVMYQVILQAIRYPLAVVYLVVFPVAFTLLGCVLVPYFKVDPPQNVNMLAVPERATCNNHMWAGNISATDGGQLYGLPTSEQYATCNALVESLIEETHDLTRYPGYDGPHHPYMAFCRSPANSTDTDWGFPAGKTSLLYNATEMWSSRSALACFVHQISTDAGVTAISTEYKIYAAQASSNGLGGGAIAGGIIANVFMILSGYYCEEQLRLRISRVKEMMLLCGLPRLVYWVSYFFSHFFLFMFSFSLCYLVMYIDGGIKSVSESSAVPMFLLAFSAAPAIIIYGYCLSFVTDDILAAQQWVNEYLTPKNKYLNLTFGMPVMLLVFAVQDEATRATLENCFFILPGFVFYKGIGNIETAATNGKPFTAGDTFDWDKGLTKFICFHWIQTFIFSFVLWAVDTKLIRRLTGPKLKPGEEVGIDDDQKLLAEKLPPIKGAAMSEKPNNLAHADTLSKCYPLEGGGSVQAVRETSLGVAKDSVLGLLGPNGAGKTTMMSMMSGIESIDSGSAWINDASVNDELAEARKLLGLCPQFDALMGNLTAREHLKIFAAIRGVPPQLATTLIERTIKDMDLTLKADERTSGYSGGNKRKLSVALSMIANPTVNFLDEPSTGMDPETRRFMWDYIASVRDGRALILTTHSMEEADALCSSIGIMIRGQLRALGTSQELKSAHGDGYQVMIRLGGGTADPEGPFTKIDALISSLSTGVKMEASATMVKRYEVPASDTTLADIFELVNANLESHGIVDFSVSQTTLEDVFLKFARQA